jgi:hypothetical protein
MCPALRRDYNFVVSPQICKEGYNIVIFSQSCRNLHHRYSSLDRLRHSHVFPKDYFMALNAATLHAPSLHSILTRLMHAGLAGTIVVQLVSSQFMNPDGAGNTAFEVHEWSGLAASGLVVAFWANTILRQRGTPLVQLLPWLSGSARTALWQDIGGHISALKARKMPLHGESAPLASAIHGLGLLLMTAMAGSGFVYYFINSGDPDAGGAVGLTMLVHTTLANLVWAYLIGHAGMGILAHLAGTLPLGRMWSLRRNKG